MTEHSVVVAIDESGRRVLVRAPWGYLVALVRSGTLADDARIEGVGHDVGAEQWRDVATGATIEVEVLAPPSEQAVAEKMFIGN